MKKSILEEISSKRYHVDKSSCTYYGNKKICNFFIEKISIASWGEKNLSFTVTLDSKEKNDTATIPIIFFDAPYAWLKYGFETEDFIITVPKAEYEKHMQIILQLLLKHNHIKFIIETIGWSVNNISPNFLPIVNEKFSFGKYVNPKSKVLTDVKPPKKNFIDTYINLIDKSISVPLVSFLLLTVLSSLQFFGRDYKVGFIMSLTGATAKYRGKVALFYLNVYRRTRNLYINDYTLFHLYPSDSLGDIRYKASAGKDSVLIAFEPDKKRCNYLNKIFGNTWQEKKLPIYSNCLITNDDAETIPFPTFNINLHNDFNILPIVNYFFDQDTYMELRDDCFMDSLYYFISQVLNNLENNEKYVIDQYNKFQVGFARRKDEMSETAYDAALKLCFAYNLYKTNCNEVGYSVNYRYIIDAAKKSFPDDGDITEKQFQTVIRICHCIDNYFLPRRRHDYILMEGEESKSDIIKLRYNEKYLYMNSGVIAEILKLENSRDKFSISTKRILAKMGLIKTYEKSDGKTEYSVHLSKQSGKTPHAQKRYIAFDRQKCTKQGNLFQNIEKFIISKKS